MVANLIKVKVDPKDLKSIPDVLPYRNLLQGEPMELELTKKEILRCMMFGDVYDLSGEEEVLIDELAFQNIVEYVEEDASEEVPGEGNGEEPGQGGTDEPVVTPDDEEPSEEPV
jgi:hypothetical protein